MLRPLSPFRRAVCSLQLSLMSLRFLAPLLCLGLLAGCESVPPRLIPVDNPVPKYGNDTYDLIAVKKQPIPRYRQPPIYPFELRRAGISGSALVDFVVDVDGSVVNAIVIKADDLRLADAARYSVQHWKFRPAEIDGKPVRCHMQVPIVFTLNDTEVAEPPAEPRQLAPDATLYEPSQLDQKPIPQYRRPPVYPVAMREAGIGGEVAVDFVVTSDGRTANVHPARATAQPFADAAVACVEYWRFRPGMKDGVPVNCHMQVPIVFTLNGR